MRRGEDDFSERNEFDDFGSRYARQTEGFGGTTPVTRCFMSHPPLAIGDYTIYGGSCATPVVKDADIYVGFDSSMRLMGGKYPWGNGVEFYYPIQDMCAPNNIESFRALIDYLCLQLIAGRKIHCGCIGGHGRTGTILAALVNVVLGEKDAIAYVRTHYCDRGVESQSQIDFLVKHFGILTAAIPEWPGKFYDCP